MRKLNEKSIFVVSNSKDKFVDPKNFRRMFEAILVKCGIEKTGVHSLRHTFASMLFRKGISAKVVSKLLGHKDVVITLNTYIHIINEQEREAIELLDEL